MHITIEQNQVIVNLDETEFPIFETMFANLQGDKRVSLEFRKFPDFGGSFTWTFAPMHLCRVIGEANLSENPFATVSLYPFWKHGFAFGAGENLSLNLAIEDPHKKGVAADEFGMGFCCWAMEEIFHCEFWADATAMIEAGFVVPTGSKCPDFVCTFPDGSLGIFEAKGTTGKVSALTSALNTGKYQTMALDAESPIKLRVVVGVALGEPTTRVIMMDPDEADIRASGRSPIPTNLNADLVKRAATKMRASIRDSASTQPPGFDTLRTQPTEEERSLSRATARIETPPATQILFRGPRRATGPTREIALTNEYKPEKNHAWLDITPKE